MVGPEQHEPFEEAGLAADQARKTGPLALVLVEGVLDAGVGRQGGSRCRRYLSAIDPPLLLRQPIEPVGDVGGDEVGAPVEERGLWVRELIQKRALRVATDSLQIAGSWAEAEAPERKGGGRRLIDRHHAMPNLWAMRVKLISRSRLSHSKVYAGAQRRSAGPRRLPSFDAAAGEIPFVCCVLTNIRRLAFLGDIFLFAVLRRGLGEVWLRVATGSLGAAAGRRYRRQMAGHGLISLRRNGDARFLS